MMTVHHGSVKYATAFPEKSAIPGTQRLELQVRSCGPIQIRVRVRVVRRSQLQVDTGWIST